MEISTLFQHTQLKQIVQDMQAGMAEAQRQVSSGKRATSYGGLGQSAGLSLSLRNNHQSRTEYQTSITAAENRVSAMQLATTRMASIADELKGEAWLATNQSAANRILMTDRGKISLDEMVSLLNTQIEDRHLFAGARTAAAPVLSGDVILKGDGLLGGLDRATTDRAAADDVTGTGLLDIPRPTGTTLRVIQRNAEFGFSINGYRADLPATVTQDSTVFPDNDLTIRLTAQPDPGRQFVLRLGMPDGTETNITLTSRAANTVDQPDTFVVGPTLADTAKNFHETLVQLVQRAAGSELKAASAITAAGNYFDTTPPRRVAYNDGVPVLVEDDPADPTLLSWYRGDTGLEKALGKPSLDATAAPNALPTQAASTTVISNLTDADAVAAELFTLTLSGADPADDVTVTNLDVSAATDGANLASLVQTALRAADGGATDITVTYTGAPTNALSIVDARGRVPAADPSLTSAGPVSYGTPLQATLAAGGRATTSIAMHRITDADAANAQTFAIRFDSAHNAHDINVTVDVSAATSGATLATAIQTKLRELDSGGPPPLTQIDDIFVTYDATNDTLTIEDARGRAITAPTLTPASVAKEITIGSLTDATADTTTRFSLDFGGGVQVSNLNVSAATDGATLAAAIEVGFADPDITVRYDASRDTLTIRDAQGRSPVSGPSLIAGLTVAGGVPAVSEAPAASTTVINNLPDTTAATAELFSFSLKATDPAYDVTVTGLDLTTAAPTLAPPADGDELAAQVQAALRAADGGTTDITVTYGGVPGTLTIVDARGRTPVAQPSLTTAAGVALGTEGPDTAASEGLPSFPATFVSVAALDDANAAKARTLSLTMTSTDARLNLTLTDLDVSGAADGADLARIVQIALRTADKGDPDISVTYNPLTDTLRVSDAKGRALQGLSLRGVEPLIKETAVTKIDDNLVVGYGRRADAAALRDTLKYSAVVALQPPSVQGEPFYEKLAQRVGDRLAVANRELNYLVTEFGIRQRTLAEVKDEHKSVNLLSLELLDKVENVDPYEAGTRALQFEKQLTMSYQITARLQNLSLTNFL